jgi:hypothetical protein
MMCVEKSRRDIIHNIIFTMASVDGFKRSRHLSEIKFEVSHRLASGQGKMEVSVGLQMSLV